MLLVFNWFAETYITNEARRNRYETTTLGYDPVGKRDEWGPCEAILGLLLVAIAPLQTAKAEPLSEEAYVTTEDIIADIIFPPIGKKIEEEYGGNSIVLSWW